MKIGSKWLFPDPIEISYDFQAINFYTFFDKKLKFPKMPKNLQIKLFDFHDLNIMDFIHVWL